MLTLAAFDSLPSIRHGFFTREGGVSEGLYASLNCGLGSNDRRDHVTRNRGIVAAHLGLPASALVTPHQVHSARVVIVKQPWDPADAPKADALVTNHPGLCLGVLSADCVPLLFADPNAGIIGAAHSGWKGARDNIAAATIEAMVALGATHKRIRVGIGPAIRQHSYEVGPEFPGHFNDAEPFFRSSARPGHYLFDLPGYIAARLAPLGLADIADLALDTVTDPRFFSYRRATLQAEPDYGRMISAIALA
jgi:YfiH family protein